MSKSKGTHPGFKAMAHTGKQHPGFKPMAKKEAVPVRGMGQPAAPAPTMPGIAPVAPIGPPQMPGVIPPQQ